MMHKALETINRTRGVLGSALVGTDGILIAAEMTDPQLADLVSALAASLADMGAKLAEASGAGAIGQILLEGDTGKVLVLGVPLGWLVVFTSATVNVGLVRVEMRQATKAIG
ncbi:MAG: roadblock/LC7 domain-containing protein [Fibrobacterota bacterium]|nr:MAG: roadblock/LC7 domain-containing protein [Fibrobacterota bacterium]